MPRLSAIPSTYMLRYSLACRVTELNITKGHSTERDPKHHGRETINLLDPMIYSMDAVDMVVRYLTKTNC